MDSRVHLEPSCDTLSIMTPGAQRKPTQTMKDEIKEETTIKCRNKEELSCLDYMYPSAEPLDPSKFVNYYDSKDNVFELKKEFPEDECSQSDCNMNSKMVTENTESFTLIKEQIVKIENTEEEMSLNLKEENVGEPYQFIIKMEEVEEQKVEENLDNAGATSIHYDDLVTPRVVQCKLCFKVFRNNFNLLKHNQEHIKVKIKIPGINVMNELHQCQYCNKHFDNHDNMLIHISIVHNKKTHRCELCGIQFKSASNLKRHIVILHKCKIPPKQVTRNSVKCKYCNEYFEHGYTLYKHMELCRTGKGDEGIKICKCDSCDCVSTNKRTLKMHIRRTHFDYGGIFHLSEQNSLRYVTTRKNENKEVYKCNCCKAVFNGKRYLSKHMKRVHYNYGRMFECWCGKKFRTPMYLSRHKTRHHDDNIKGINNTKFQCDSCQRIYTRKRTLLKHIRNIHYDYGKVFECRCGKKFRTPMYLSDHKNRYCRRYDGNIKDTNNGKFQCDYCHKCFSAKHVLALHIQSIHYDYDKVFECWCGKHFRTPIHLSAHKRKQHDGNIKRYK